jgi:hypothetical protein
MVKIWGKTIGMYHQTGLSAQVSQVFDAGTYHISSRKKYQHHAKASKCFAKKITV